MRELGRRGGEARRKGTAEKLPEQERQPLREAVRGLDHDLVKGAIERALAGGNESARVSAVKLLADLELYRGDGECPVCARRKENPIDVEAKLLGLLARHEPERKAKIRAAVHEDLSVLAERVDPTQVGERLVDRL